MNLIINWPSCLVFTVALLIHPLAQAELSGSISGTTDYIRYGYSLSDGGPAIQANLDYEHTSGLFLGVSVSSIDYSDRNRGDSSRVEIAPYLGWNFELSHDWRLDLQWQRYLYDDRVFGQVVDYNMWSFTANYLDLMTARVSLSDNVLQQNHIATFFDVFGRYPVTDSIETSAGIGYSLSREALEYDYLYWNAGVTWFHPYGSLDFRYVQSKYFRELSIHSGSGLLSNLHEVHAKFVFTISFGF